MKQYATLKFKTPYGMTTGPGSFRPHLVDTYRSKLRWLEDAPEDTQYQIRWFCKIPGTKYPLRFLSERELPPGVDMCRACLIVKDNIEIFLAKQRVWRENLPWRTEREYIQSPEAPF